MYRYERFRIEKHINVSIYVTYHLFEIMYYNMAVRYKNKRKIKSMFQMRMSEWNKKAAYT